MFHPSFPDVYYPFVLISLFNFGAFATPNTCEPPAFTLNAKPATVSSFLTDITPEEKSKALKLPGELSTC